MNASVTLLGTVICYWFNGYRSSLGVGDGQTYLSTCLFPPVFAYLYSKLAQKWILIYVPV